MPHVVIVGLNARRKGQIPMTIRSGQKTLRYSPPGLCLPWFRYRLLLHDGNPLQGLATLDARYYLHHPNILLYLQGTSPVYLGTSSLETKQRDFV